MEIDEIKRCAWPWAACTVLGHRGAWARLARRGGRGLAVPPVRALFPRAREGVRGHAHGRAVWLSAPQGQRRGLEAVWALSRACRSPAPWAGVAGTTAVAHLDGHLACLRHGRTVWRIAHRGLARGVNCVGRGRRWPLPFGVGRVTSCIGIAIAGRRRGLRPSVRSPTPCVPRRPARRCPAVAPPASPAPAVPHPARRVRGGPKPVHATRGSSEAVQGRSASGRA